MAKANDKKLVREATAMLALALGNMLQTERERKFRTGKKKPLTRDSFCQKVGLNYSSVTRIETGVLLQQDFASAIRPYLAALECRNDRALLTSFRKAHEGLNEIESFLRDF